MFCFNLLFEFLPSKHLQYVKAETFQGPPIERSISADRPRSMYGVRNSKNVKPVGALLVCLAVIHI
jgi:hypothetical protein